MWQFNEECENVDNIKQIWHLYLIDDDLIAAANAKIMMNRCFTLTTLSLEFLQISRLLLHDIGYKKFVLSGYFTISLSSRN